MNGIIIPSKAPNYILTMQGTSVPLYSRPIPAPKVTRMERIARLATRTDAHRKLSGHLVMIIVGLATATVEIILGVNPIILTLSQFIVPNIVQEAYDFIYQL